MGNENHGIPRLRFACWCLVSVCVCPALIYIACCNIFLAQMRQIITVETMRDVSNCSDVLTVWGGGLMGKWCPH